MAKYKAIPFYGVSYGDGKRIEFDANGEYETKLKAEITVLDGLCPRYIKCIQSDKKTSAKDEE